MRMSLAVLSSIAPRIEMGGVPTREKPPVADRRLPKISLPDPETPARPPRDRRYSTSRWQKLRLRVLERDGWVCQVAHGCPERASVADHIEPVYPGMPDSLFFSPANLRASCRRHNTARGVAARLERETRAPADSSVVTGDYS